MGIISNRLIIEKQHKRYRSLRLAFSTIEHSMKYVDPHYLINRTLKLRGSTLTLRNALSDKKNLELDLNDFNSVYLIGAGKATAGMAEALHAILNGIISFGAINVPYGNTIQIDDVMVTEASHPVPDKAGVNGTKKMVDILTRTKHSDLVFILISGGGSALMPLPLKGLAIEDKQRIINSMMSAGASIDEINVVRKHLSMVKGGKLLRFVKRGCTVVSLILSDVIGDKIETIASGPTAPDNSTFKDAALILMKYDIWSKEDKNSAVKRIINDGINGVINETVKPGDPVSKNVYNFVIGNNVLVCRKAELYLQKYGLKTVNLASSFDGEAKNFGYLLSQLAAKIQKFPKSFAFVLGGETTVKLNSSKKTGIGGRNQEAILAAALRSNFHLRDDIAILCMGTDGIDGNSNAAGGFLTPKIASLVKENETQMVTYLDNHDSYSALKKIDSLIVTGRTGTNVNDISIICKVNLAS